MSLITLHWTHSIPYHFDSHTRKKNKNKKWLSVCCVLFWTFLYNFSCFTKYTLFWKLLLPIYLVTEKSLMSINRDLRFCNGPKGQWDLRKVISTSKLTQLFSENLGRESWCLESQLKSFTSQMYSIRRVQW